MSGMMSDMGDHRLHLVNIDYAKSSKLNGMSVTMEGYSEEGFIMFQFINWFAFEAAAMCFVLSSIEHYEQLGVICKQPSKAS